VRSPLDAAALAEALVGPGSPWGAVEYHAEVDSTNAQALRARRPWHVVLADHQRAGRGRMRREWRAPPRASVAVSVLLPLPQQEWGWVPLLAGLAMLRAIEDTSRLRAGLKWPNDVLVGAGKVCGVLCELLPARAPGRPEGVVVGAGVNVDQTRDELPAGTATSLALCGAATRREELVVAYLGRLAEVHAAALAGGPAARGEHAAYRERCVTLGRVVHLGRPGGSGVSGRACGVDEQGRLLIDSAGGRSAWAAGDVVHVRPTRDQPVPGLT